MSQRRSATPLLTGRLSAGYPSDALPAKVPSSSGRAKTPTFAICESFPPARSWSISMFQYGSAVFGETARSERSTRCSISRWKVKKAG